MGPDEFKALAQTKGLAGPNLKAGMVLGWLKEEYGLGHGQGMAVRTPPSQVDVRPRMAPQNAQKMGISS
jgi:hypothetical protein